MTLPQPREMAATQHRRGDAPDGCPAVGTGPLIHGLSLELVGAKERPELPLMVRVG